MSLPIHVKGLIQWEDGTEGVHLEMLTSVLDPMFRAS